MCPTPAIFDNVFGAIASVAFHADNGGGCDCVVPHNGRSATERPSTTVGRVSVLLAMNVAVDFGFDIRNHAPARILGHKIADH